jgi:RNA ligase (TIGR02306 family)
MSKLEILVVKIDAVHKHPNADRLDFARVGGYWVVTGKGEYKVGDNAIYFPIDSILPIGLQGFLFSGTKMKLKDNRVRAAKIRGHVSQGLLASADSIMDYFISIKKVHRVGVGDDLTKALQVTKHEPSIKAPRGMNNVAGKTKRYCHENFRKYTSINHLQKFDTLFKDGENVLVTEKLHGTNFRAGWVPYKPRTLWARFKKFIRYDKRSWEFVVGSHNVQTTMELDNVYSRIAKEHHLISAIPLGQVWYGEIIGSGIQANYDYGYGPGMIDVFFMDVMLTKLGTYMNFENAKYCVECQGEKMVPSTSVPYNLANIHKLLNTLSIHSSVDANTLKEGYVVRSVREDRTLGQRRILKLLAERFLLQKGNTDFH